MTAQRSPRLLSESGSAAERRLLASARVDAPPRGAAERMGSVLGNILVEVPPQLEAAYVEAKGKPPGFGMKPLLGLMLGGSVVAWLLWAQLSAKPSPDASAAPASALELSPSHFTEGAAPRPSLEPQPESAASSGSSSAPSEPAQRGRAPRRAGPRSSLLEEVRALDAIRSALGAGEVSAAARQLQRYRQRFPSGELRLEGEVLSVDLALAQGQTEQARARAQQLLAEPDAARYAERLRRVPVGGAAPSRLEGTNGAPAHIGERR